MRTRAPSITPGVCWSRLFPSLWPWRKATLITRLWSSIAGPGNGDGRTLAPACFKRLPKSWMRLSSLDDKCSASLAIEKNGAQKCAKTWEIEEKYKKMTLILLAHECRKHCKTQEKKKQKTMARRMSSTEMCAKTMRLASNVYHMNAKNRENVGSVSHPPGCLRCLRNLPCPIYTYIYTYICIYVCMYLGWGLIPWMWPWSTNTSCIGRICWLSHVKRIKQCHSLHEIHVPILLD